MMRPRACLLAALAFVWLVVSASAAVSEPPAVSSAGPARKLLQDVVNLHERAGLERYHSGFDSRTNKPLKTVTFQFTSKSPAFTVNGQRGQEFAVPGAVHLKGGGKTYVSASPSVLIELNASGLPARVYVAPPHNPAANDKTNKVVDIYMLLSRELRKCARSIHTHMLPSTCCS
jgi:hypothetical protein